MGSPIKPGDLELQDLKYLRFIDPEDSTKIIQIALEDTGFTTGDGLKIYSLSILPSGSGMNVIIVAKTIGSITQTGSGLDDISNSGEFTGEEDVDYEIIIDGTGTPDTFKWSDDGGATYTELVAITGAAQELSNGVYIKFAATTGHTLADKWKFTARAADPTSIQKSLETIIACSFIAAGDIESDPVDLRNVREATLTISGDFDGAAALGMTVEIFTSPDGLNWDTDAWADTGLEPTVTPGSTSQRTTNLDAIPAFMKVKITNHDALAVGGVYARLVKLEV